uniref:Stimulated by retinoic acid gene 6 protein homolog n=1 Tax=Saccoglossus kowalevskii TaxID=10224 RepID=A0ABM0MBY0_SACKO|nr:PREDICTED: stimulated by retinoic acid gene 6 protein homolog [Saccoglossus kowalevskii]
MSYCEREYCVNVTDILLSRLPEDHSSWPGDELLQYMHDTYNVTDEFVEYLKVCYDYIDREEFSEEFLDWLNQWLFGEYGCDNPRYTFSSWLGFSLMPAIDWKGKHRPAKLKKRHHDYLYVKNLLRPPPEKPKKETIRMKIRNILYKNVPGFKYSRKLISTLVVCAIVLFQVSFIQYAAVGTSLEYGCYEFFSEGGEGEEFFASINKSDLYEDAREITCTIYHTFMWSAYVTVVIYYAYLIHMVPVYRRYMLQMYRGDKSFWPPNLQSNVNLLVSSLKYSGYQIAYVLWGYIITQLILWVILFAVVYMIILAIQDDRSSLLLTLVAEYWFSAVFAVFLYIYQILVTKYIFLLEYGNVLGLNNRRLFHIVNYLLFFFNVILGLFSCLFRILKSMIFGVLFLGRTDRCLLMKGFETFDTGFTAYMGFLKVEETHMHPVLVTFCDILLTQTPVLTSNLPVNRDDSNNDDKRVSKLFSSRRNKNTMVTEADLEIESLVQAYRSCKVARNRWFVAYTLVRNPSVVSHRSPVPLLQKMMARSDDK